MKSCVSQGLFRPYFAIEGDKDSLKILKLPIVNSSTAKMFSLSMFGRNNFWCMQLKSQPNPHILKKELMKFFLLKCGGLYINQHQPINRYYSSRKLAEATLFNLYKPKHFKLKTSAQQMAATKDSINLLNNICILFRSI